MEDEIQPIRRSARISSSRESPVVPTLPNPDLSDTHSIPANGSNNPIVPENDTTIGNQSNMDFDSDHNNHCDDDWIAHSRLKTGPRARVRSHSTDTVHERAISKRRTYSFVKRISNPRSISGMRKRWQQFLLMTDDQLRSQSCCQSNKCFSVVNIPFLRDKMQHYLSIPTSERRKVLHSMCTSAGEYIFDGRAVCVIFLKKAFRFSPDLISEVRRQPNSVFTNLPDGIREAYHSASSCRSSMSGNNDNSDSFHTSLGMDSIILFLDRIVEDTADLMPDRDEIHLPFFRKNDVYELFVRDFKKLYPKSLVPTSSYFYYIWKKYKSNVKVRRDTRFTKCSTCERLRDALEEAIRLGQPTDELKKQKKEHNEFVALERREYKRKCELAILRPSEYLSFIIDGADQSAFTLPHFVTKIKDSRGHGLKVHLIGVLQHCSINKLTLFTMTDDHQSGANHIIECIHRFINDRARDQPLPRRLFIQGDNCVRENKNQYLFSFLEALVLWNVFDCVEVGFLPVGHTHSDIDQAFSTTAERLRYHNAVTLPELHHQVSQCYNEHTVVSSLGQVANWSGLCDKLQCNNTIKYITQFRYFRFSLSDSLSTNGNRSAICHVRSSCIEDWKPLKQPGANSATSVLRFLPRLALTPPEVIKSPPDRDEFIKRIDSERGRIASEAKVRTLTRLGNDFFRDKSVPFHWDLDSIVEATASNVSRYNSQDNATSPTHPVTSSRTYKYDVGSFAAVNTGIKGQGEKFWICKVADVNYDNSRKITSLSVHWYQHSGSTDVYTAKYKPSLLINDNGKNNNNWIDDISTDTILVSFQKLTNQNRLPSSVATYLRELFCIKNDVLTLRRITWLKW